jgi:WD40 repeat protein
MRWFKSHAALLFICLTVAEGWQPAFPAAGQQPEAAPKNDPPLPPIAPNGAKHVDAFGDPLPTDVHARLGTVRFRPGMVIQDLVFSPTGAMLASAGRGGSGICLWDVATGLPLLRRGSNNFNLAFSPDGKTFVAGNLADNLSLHLIDIATGKELRRLEKPAGTRLYYVAFSSDGRTVAVVEATGAANAIILWDAASGQEMRRLEGHADFIVSLAFSPDGKVLASGSDDETIRLWDVAAGKEIRTIQAHKEGVSRVAFSPEGNTLASVGYDYVIRLWDAGTGKELRQFQIEKEEMRTFAFAPDGKVLASAGQAGDMIRLWDVASGKELRKWLPSTQYVSTLAFSPDGKVLASGGVWDHAIRLWDPGTGAEITPAAGHTGVVDQIMYAPDGKTLYSCGMDRKAIAWDTTTGRQQRLLFAGPADATESRWRMAPYRLSPDAKILARAPRYPSKQKPDPIIRLWDTTGGKELRQLVGHTDQVYLVTFSPNSKLAGSRGKDRTRIWDVAGGKELLHLKTAQGAAFSPDSKVVAVTGQDRTIQLWDIAAARELRRWQSNQDGIGQLFFAPDGNSIAATANDGAVYVWATKSGKELRMVGADGSINALDFSATSRILATSVRIGGDRSVIHLWEAVSGQEIRKIETPPGWWAWSLAFAPDSRTLAGGGADSTILTWDLTAGAQDRLLKKHGLSAQELDALWSDLKGDAAKAERALWLLAFKPDQSVPFLKERLQPPPPAPAGEIARLVTDLDSDRFAVRQQAKQTLEALGEAAEAGLRHALKDNITLEVRRRIEQILDIRSADVFRKLRAVAALEQIGTAQARQILEMLARRTANDTVVESAALAMKRMVNQTRNSEE